MTDPAPEPPAPKCVVCRQVPCTTGQTCLTCVQETAQLLTDISRWHTDARTGLGRRVASFAPGTGSRGATDGRPLPGGDLLALTGPGSPGYAETGETDKPDDPRSVLFELRWWEQQWRTHYSEPDPAPPTDWSRLIEQWTLTSLLEQVSADCHALDRASRTATAAQATATRNEITRAMQRQPARAPDTSLTRAVNYLRSRHHQAARSHPGFARYAQDLRDLHALLGQATGRIRRPRRLPADCLDCGAQLHIEVDQRTGLEKTVPGTTLAEEASCPGCQRRYLTSDYRLARAMTVRRNSTWTDKAGEEWATPETTATLLGRSSRTIRDWQRRDLIRSTVLGGRMFVCTADAATEHEQRAERDRRKQEERDERAG